MQASKQISPEEAELIRRGVLGGCRKFISAGAIITEIEKHTFFNPRVLMAPEKKLLMAPEDSPPILAPSPMSPTPPVEISEPQLSDQGLVNRLRELEQTITTMQATQTPKAKRKRKATDAPPA